MNKIYFFKNLRNPRFTHSITVYIYSPLLSVTAQFLFEIFLCHSILKKISVILLVIRSHKLNLRGQKVQEVPSQNFNLFALRTWQVELLSDLCALRITLLQCDAMKPR